MRLGSGHYLWWGGVAPPTHGREMFLLVKIYDPDVSYPTPNIN
jgi:hypothetical protein